MRPTKYQTDEERTAARTQYNRRYYAKQKAQAQGWDVWGNQVA